MMRLFAVSTGLLVVLLGGAGPVGAEPPALTPVSAWTCSHIADAAGNALGAKFAVDSVRMTYFGEAGPLNGTGCRIAAKGTGAVFGPDFRAVAVKLASMLEAEGWTSDPAADADGPTGTAEGFRSGGQVALASVGYEPAPGACAADAPIASCTLRPEQMRYTITLDLAQAGGG